MNVAIVIHIDNDIVGLRRWPAVPHMGDIVMIGKGGAKQTPLHVIRVTWLSGADGETCEAHLHCKEMKKK